MAAARLAQTWSHIAQLVTKLLIPTSSDPFVPLVQVAEPPWLRVMEEHFVNLQNALSVAFTVIAGGALQQVLCFTTE